MIFWDNMVSCTYNITLSPNYELSPKNQGLDTLYGMFSTFFFLSNYKFVIPAPSCQNFLSSLESKECLENLNNFPSGQFDISTRDIFGICKQTVR